MLPTESSSNFFIQLKNYFSHFNFKSSKESSIYRLLIIQSIFEGLTQGIFYLQEAIAKKALNATAFNITVIGILMHFALFFAFYFGYKAAGKNKFKYYIIALFLGRLIFLTSFLIKNIHIFIFYLFVYYLFSAIQSPGVNAIFQNTFKKELVGKLFSIFRVFLNLMGLIISLIFGKLLDINNHLYPYILCFAAITGSVSFLLLAIIDKKINYKPIHHKKRIFHTFFNILKTNKEFFWYEVFFMIYGFGFMFMLPSAPIFLLNKLNFSYTQMALVKGLFTQFFIIVLLPLAGIIYDKISVWRIFSISQIFLLVYPLTFLFASLFIKCIPISTLAIIIYIGYLFFGAGLTGITIVWNLASIHFAQNEDSSMFQGVHVTLTGIRGLLGPFLSYIVLKIFNFNMVFIFAILFFLTAYLGSKLYYNKKVIAYS